MRRNTYVYLTPGNKENPMHILEEIRAAAGISHDMTMLQLRLIEPIPSPMTAFGAKRTLGADRQEGRF